MEGAAVLFISCTPSDMLWLFFTFTDDTSDPVDVPSHSERRSGSVQIGQNQGIVGYTQTIDLQCKSANLVQVPRYDRIKL